jgi:hypothetical protein
VQELEKTQMKNSSLLISNSVQQHNKELAAYLAKQTKTTIGLPHANFYGG